MIKLGLAFAIVIASAPAAAEQPQLTPGRVSGNVAVWDFPGESYVLYLPSNYSAERSWPILYVLDPRARGRLGAELFRAAAEKYGYIIASSNNSHSDVQKDPNVRSVNAMWADTHDRFKVDPRRTYVAGFSGTVRAAVFISRHVPAGSFTGIIGAGAGYPPYMSPRSSDRFLFFGTVGTRDFNYEEMMELEPKLAKAGIVHHIEVFDGTHQWPPEPLTLRALGWLDLQAIKAGTRARDAALVESLWTEAIQRARASEAAGDLVAAHRIWTSASHDFAGLRDVSDAEERSSALAADPLFKRQSKKRRRSSAREP